MSDLSKKELLSAQVPTRVGLIVLALAFVYLMGIHGYSTGYQFERVSIGSWLWTDWTSETTDWSFGMFVFPVTVGLYWVTRERFDDVKIQSSAVLGFVVLLIGFFFFFGGYKANERYFGYMGLHFVVAGTLIWFLGWGWFKRGFWLWMLLGWMWPWLFLEGAVSNVLQKTMVKLTAGFLNFIGDPCVANGSEVTSMATETQAAGERFRLSIGLACSGMRSLFALVLIGIAYAYVGLRSEWKRWVLVALIPLIAILGNFARMMMLYVGVLWWGSEFAIGEGDGNESSYHIGSGLIVFVVALLLLSFSVAFLNRRMKIFNRKKQVVRRMQKAADK